MVKQQVFFLYFSDHICTFFAVLFVTVIFLLYSSNGGSKTTPALCQWSEVMNHPGLVCCVQQTTGIPLVVMIKPDSFMIQEIKTLPAKAKVSGGHRHGGKG